MSSYLRLSALNAFRSIAKINLSAENALVQQHRFINIQLQADLKDFKAKRKTWVMDSDFKGNNKTTRTSPIYRNLFDLIYTSKTDNNVQEILSFLKENKSFLSKSRKNNSDYSVQIMRLLYTLKQTEKSIEMFTDQVSKIT